MFSFIPKSLPFCRLAAVKYQVVSNCPQNNPKRETHVFGNVICPNMTRGMDHMRDPRLNKGHAFTLEERQALGLNGLLAPIVKTQEEQVQLARVSINRYKNPLNKYLFLVELVERNERLFYSLLDTNIEKYLPIISAPTVGLACQKFGFANKRTKGMFISINDKGHIYKLLQNWPEPDVRAICFTDGERVLGLGDLGAYGMGIPIGKLTLYTALGGIMPHQCLPITLDVGTDNMQLLEDPLYIGIRRKRVRGQEYFDFIDEFMAACVERYTPTVLLHFEDFALQNAMPLLEKYRDHYCTFNDDIQGTASAAVAGLLTASRITKLKMSENVYMYLGAGSASNGIADLSVLAMQEEGMSEEAARDRIFMFDIEGLLSTKREGGVPDHAKKYGKDVPAENNFEAVVAKYKPTVLIGCSTVGGAFTPTILKQMANNAERPVIFALSNPISKSECTAQQAYDHTEGRCVFASGSSFPPVVYNNKKYMTGRGNNLYIFPGVALGVIAAEAISIPNLLFLTAAKTLANLVTEEDLAVGRIYPPLNQAKSISTLIAVEVVKICYDSGIATNLPKPCNDLEFVKKHIYDLKYPSFMPESYPHPPPPEKIRVKNIEEAYGKYLYTSAKK